MDIEGFGRKDRTRSNNVAIRAGLFRAVRQAFAESGIPWAKCHVETAGDNILALAPATVAKGAFAGALPGALVAALGAHNETHPPEERIRLRLALDAGEVTFDDHGFTARAVTHAARLLDSRPLKEALANSPGPLAMIVSDWFYDDVVSQYAEYEPHSYRRVSVDVKETTCVGWLRVPGHDLPAMAEPVESTEPAESTESIEVAAVENVIELPVLASVLRPSSPEFYEVVTALEDIECMRGEHTRSLVLDQLWFAGNIRYFGSRRLHLVSILRTCCDFDGGVIELVRAIADIEPSDSLPLRRLLKLLTGDAT